MDRFAQLRRLIVSDPWRMRVLRFVHALGLPDCWVAAGFVRSCVWDHLHGYPASPALQDIDVIWFDPEQPAAEQDAALERVLRACDASLAWSVKNQARMHQRNADKPYSSAIDAMRYWPETATAVGVRMGAQGHINIAAPFGLDDLFALRVCPTEAFSTDKYGIYLERIRARQWTARWPCLTIQTRSHQGSGIASPRSSTTGTGDIARMP